MCGFNSSQREGSPSFGNRIAGSERGAFFGFHEKSSEKSCIYHRRSVVLSLWHSSSSSSCRVTSAPAHPCSGASEVLHDTDTNAMRMSGCITRLDITRA